MPDLPDDLAALLRARAGDAPEPPAPSAALVRSVRRRQAFRAGATALAGAASVATIVAIAAAVVTAGEPAGIGPANPGPPGSAPATAVVPPEDNYEFCTRQEQPDLVVSVHPTELKFDHGCYRVAAGATKVHFTNSQIDPHDLAIASEGGRPFFATNIIVPGEPDNVAEFTGRLPSPLAAGDYELTCTVHPTMHAQLVVR